MKRLTNRSIKLLTMSLFFREDAYSAIYKGDVNRVKELVNSDNVNNTCEYNGSLLSFAVTTRSHTSAGTADYTIIEYLLDIGANPDVLTPMRLCTLREYATLIGDTTLYELLTVASNIKC